MPRARRRYTEGARAAAVGRAEVTSIEESAEHFGIPRKTVEYWMDKPEFAELRRQTREVVGDQFWSAIQVGIRRIVELIPKTDDLQKVSVATGILYDKHALLTGSATSRTEARDITGTLSDGEIIAAIREADRIAGSEGTAPETPSEATG